MPLGANTQQLDQAIAHIRAAVRSLQTAAHMAGALPQRQAIERGVYDLERVLKQLESDRLVALSV